MKIKKFSNYLNEAVDNDIQKKMKEPFLTVKIGILELINNSIEKEEERTEKEIKKIAKKVSNKSTDNIKINGFIEDNEIQNFYLKYKNEIDELLQEEDYFNTPPNQNAVYGLYDFMIDGTKKAFDSLCAKIVEELG